MFDEYAMMMPYASGYEEQCEVIGACRDDSAIYGATLRLSDARRRCQRHELLHTPWSRISFMIRRYADATMSRRYAAVTSRYTLDTTDDRTDAVTSARRERRCADECRERCAHNERRR